jgi:hypothetical protein
MMKNTMSTPSVISVMKVRVQIKIPGPISYLELCACRHGPVPEYPQHERCSIGYEPAQISDEDHQDDNESLFSYMFIGQNNILGLRGYYLDTLQHHFGPTTSGLVNGTVWAIWHAPFVWFPGYYANTTFNPELYWWLPMIVCQTLLMVQVYNRTDRSILAVLIFHGMMNFTGEWLRISPDMYPFMLTGNLLAAVLLVCWWNRKKV